MPTISEWRQSCLLNRGTVGHYLRSPDHLVNSLLLSLWRVRETMGSTHHSMEGFFPTSLGGTPGYHDRGIC